MNCDAIGAIAQLPGAMGLIASMVCLATQVRHDRARIDQDTRATRPAAYQ